MIFTRDDSGDQDRATLVLSGEIDAAAAPALRHVVDNLPLTQLRRLTVDLGEVPFMDSTGVAFLVVLCKRMPAGSEVVIDRAHPIVSRILQLSGMGALVELSPEAEPVDATG